MLRSAISSITPPNFLPHCALKSRVKTNAVGCVAEEEDNFFFDVKPETASSVTAAAVGEVGEDSEEVE